MIPKVIHRIWLGGSEPDWTKGFASTWDLPGWELVQWGEYDVAEYLYPLENQETYDDASEIVPGHEGQLRSDLLRYEILHRYGGVYVDHDFECLKDISPLIGDAECFATWEKQNVWIANGLMGAVPDHPFLSALIRGIPDSVDSRGKRFRPNKITGPQYLTHRWSQCGRLCAEILPEKYFYPYGYADVETTSVDGDWGDAYAVHHWHNKRRLRGIAPCP